MRQVCWLVLLSLAVSLNGVVVNRVVAQDATTSLAAGVKINKSGIPYAEYDMVEDVVYGHKDGLALTLDVLTPKKDPKGVGLILVSSGSWKSGKSDVAEDEARRRNEDHWAQGLLNGGFTLFVVRHGSGPRYFVPEMVKDMNRSVRFVRSVAKKYGVSPDHLGITSGSSGGHLALMAAVTGDDGNPESKDPLEKVSSKVQCVVAWFPPTDMINWGYPNGYTAIESIRPGLFETMFGKVDNLEERLKEISPFYFVTEKSPPLLLIHGDSDRTVPLQQSTVLKEKYESLKLPVDLIVKEGGGHSGWPGLMEQYERVWEWFDRYLK